MSMGAVENGGGMSFHCLTITDIILKIVCSCLVRVKHQHKASSGNIHNKQVDFPTNTYKYKRFLIFYIRISLRMSLDGFFCEPILCLNSYFRLFCTEAYVTEIQL